MSSDSDMPPDFSEHLGRVLNKALHDSPYDYACKLRTGEVVRFVGAEWDGGEWIHLLLCEDPSLDGKRHGLPIFGERGVDVRLSDIVRAADAPDGS